MSSNMAFTIINTDVRIINIIIGFIHHFLRNVLKEYMKHGDPEVVIQGSVDGRCWTLLDVVGRRCHVGASKLGRCFDA